MTREQNQLCNPCFSNIQAYVDAPVPEDNGFHARAFLCSVSNAAVKIAAIYLSD